jgi:hypothetical protein
VCTHVFDVHLPPSKQGVISGKTSKEFLADIFAEADTDSSGSLSTVEFAAVLEKLMGEGGWAINRLNRLVRRR